jgi:hypothetical protein
MMTYEEARRFHKIAEYARDFEFFGAAIADTTNTANTISLSFALSFNL